MEADNMGKIDAKLKAIEQLVDETFREYVRDEAEYDNSIFSDFEKKYEYVKNNLKDGKTAEDLQNTLGNLNYDINEAVKDFTDMNDKYTEGFNKIAESIGSIEGTYLSAEELAELEKKQQELAEKSKSDIARRKELEDELKTDSQLEDEIKQKKDEIKENAEKIAELENQIDGQDLVASANSIKELAELREKEKSLNGELGVLNDKLLKVNEKRNELDAIKSRQNTMAREAKIVKDKLNNEKEKQNKTDELKSKLAEQAKAHIATSEKTHGYFKDMGINVDYNKPDLSKLEKKEKEKDKAPQDNDKNPDTKKTGTDEKTPENNSKSVPKATAGNGVVYTNQTEAAKTDNLPTVTPKEIKEKNYSYIIGYSKEGVGLTPSARLDRIKSELGGRDYEAMILAYKDLNNPEINLSMSEKNAIKKMMRVDRENLYKEMRTKSYSDFESLVGPEIGISIEDDALSALYENTYEALGGFKNIDNEDLEVYESAINSYYKWKNELFDREKNEDGFEISAEDYKKMSQFEKQVVTPFKFGTLQEESRDICKNRFFKFLGGKAQTSEGKIRNQKIEDTISTIAQAEANGEQMEAVRKSINYTTNRFKDDISGQTFPPKAAEQNYSDRTNQSQPTKNQNQRPTHR